MFDSLFSLIGSSNSRIIRKYRAIVGKINEYEEAMIKLSDEELANKTNEFKDAISQGKTLDDVLPEAFAVVREASKRILGMRHFDVQLIGGIALHKAQIAEMKTGEGKTLVATTAVYLNALTGKGVHVITVNDYLAKRDAAQMGRLYGFLGLTTGVIVSGMSDYQKRDAYAADITYGTNHEFGFDYLRDNLKFREEDLVMRPFNFAVIDEVDSILIDEARTPLIISGADNDSSQLYVDVNELIKDVEPDDYEKDEKLRVVTLTDKGVEKIEKRLIDRGLLNVPSLYDPSNITVVYHVINALRANKLFTRDIDYMVKDNQVLIIDEFTGRVLDGRRYSEGLHQAIEAKEGVPVQPESQTIATISYQNLFRLYPKLSGMTGTAMTEEAEFDEIYKLRVVAIPPNKPVIRIDHEDSMFVTMAEKDRAVLALIKECHARKQPVLVGTTNLERSEHFSRLLTAEGIKHNVLNAKQHEREATIVAEAGVLGAVTIATNMAGRGTDIKLGGSYEMRVATELEGITDPDERAQKLEQIQADIKKAYDEVAATGGLFVIGTERNDSRRIDNQLRGRSGRQGDPGASKYFVSLEDDLMRKFGSPNLVKRFRKVCKDNEELSFRWMSKAIAKAQQRVEAYNFDIRKQLLKYDDVMNDQRKIVYDLRNELMRSEDLSEKIKEITDDVIDNIVTTIAPANTVPAEWDIESLTQTMWSIYKIQIQKEEIENDTSMTAELLRQRLENLVTNKQKERVEQYGEDTFKNLYKDIAMRNLDSAWRNHLINLEHLRRGINLRAYAQKNPLNEYKFEAFNIFNDMIYKLKVDILTAVYGIELKQPSGEDFLGIAIPEIPSIEEIKKEIGDELYNDISRNAPCPCGSGKRFKHCHGAIKTIYEEPEIPESSENDEHLHELEMISNPGTNNKNDDPSKAIDEYIKEQRAQILNVEKTHKEKND